MDTITNGKEHESSAIDNTTLKMPLQVYPPIPNYHKTPLTSPSAPSIPIKHLTLEPINLLSQPKLVDHAHPFNLDLTGRSDRNRFDK